MQENTARKPLAVLVGDGASQLHPTMKNYFTHWDFQQPISHFSSEIKEIKGGDGKIHRRKGKAITPNPNIAELNRRVDAGLQGDESHNYDVFILIDQMFSATGADTSFEDFIKELAPYALVTVVSFQPEYQQSIIRRVEKISEGTVTAENFYFINAATWSDDLNSATDKFIAKNINNEDAQETAHNLMVGKKLQQAYQTNTTNIDTTNTTEPDSNHFYEKGHGKIIAVTSSKGGSGKSTTAIGLSTTLAHYLHTESQVSNTPEPKIILIDFDVLDGQLGFFTGHTKPNISIINSRGVNDTTIQEATIQEPKLKIDLMLAPRDPLNAKEISLETYEKLLNALTHTYDYIFVDTSIHYTDDLIKKILYPMSDIIIPVSETIRPSVGSITRWIKNVTGEKTKGRMGINPNKILFTYNKYLAQDTFNLDPQELQQVAEGLKISTVTPFVQSYISTAVKNNNLALMLTSDALRLSWKQVCQDILGRPLIDEQTFATHNPTIITHH